MGAQTVRSRIESVARLVDYQRGNLVTPLAHNGSSSSVYMDVLRKVNRLTTATYWFRCGIHVKQQIEQEYR